MSKHLESGSSKHSKVTKVAATTVSACVVAGALLVMAFIPGRQLSFGNANPANASVVQEVSPKVMDQYCPAQMGLADTGTYGDKEFQASVGDLASGARYAAFGSIFHAQVSPLGDDSKSTVLQGPQSDDADSTADSVVVASFDSAEAPQVFETRLLGASAGTGASGSMASWASNGDIAGVAASTCINMQLNQSFLISGTKEGTTQQLLIANPTDKSTTVQLSMTGTKPGQIVMATQSSVVVGAGEQRTVDLAAAAPNQDALRVNLVSQESPVASVIRTVSMKGLDPDGNDFTLPLNPASTTQIVNMGDSRNAMTLRAYASQAASLNLSWITQSGVKSAGKRAMKANVVNVMELNDIPDDALGLLIESDADFQAAAGIDVSDGGSRDFAFVNAASPYAQSALALPSGVQAHVSMVNASSKPIELSLTAYDEHGESVGTRDIHLDGDSAVMFSPTDISKNAVALSTDYEGNDVVWGAFLTSDKVSSSDHSGLAYIGADRLEVAKQTVRAMHDATIVH